MECTFRPQIKHLKFFKHGRDVAGSRFEHLFYDAEHRRRRQAEYLQWYPEGFTFRPCINRHIHGQGDYPPGETVFDRLMQYASKLTEKKQKLKQQYLKDLTDPMTGQKLFNPVTGRKPHYDRNRAALPIGEFLYQLHMILDRKKSLLAEKLMRERMQGSKGHFVLRKSERLVQNLKIRQLKKIFDYLDTDKDGIVDMDSLDRRHIPYDLIRKFEGLRDLEGFESRLSLQKFIHLMLSAQRRTGDALRALRERSPRNDNYQMSFRMCRYSRILSTQSRKYNTKKQWLKIIAADIHRRQQKVESLRRESIGREMAECTFQPATRWRTDGKTHYGSHKHFHRKSSMLDKGDEEVHGFIFQEPSQSSRPSRRLSQIQEELG